MTTQTRQHLKKEVVAVGIPWAKMKPLLPDWWEEVASDPAGIVELRGFIAKHFGLDIDRVQGGLCLRKQSTTYFKTRKGTNGDKLILNQGVVAAVARQVAYATSIPWSQTFPSAVELRNTILAQGQQWIRLNDLVESCWQHGIPVVWLPDLPFAHKMQGVAMFCCGRPVIVINKKPDKPGWALFTLAHEMGHVALGHLACTEGSVILDKTVTGNGNEQQEQDADLYADSLLTGGKTFDLCLRGRSLADIVAMGSAYGINPSFLVLKDAHSFGGYSGIKKKLEEIEPGQTASVVCRQALQRYVDLQQLPDESEAFLERLGLGK